MINSKKVFQTRKDSKDLLGGAQILKKKKKKKWKEYSFDFYRSSSSNGLKLSIAGFLQISISTLPKILITKFGGQFYSKLVAYILYSRCGKTQYINWTPAVRFL